MKIETDTDIEYLLKKAEEEGGKGLFMHESIKEKIDVVLHEVDDLLRESKKYFIASSIFFALSILCIFLDFVIIQIMSLIGALIMWYFQSRYDRQVVRKMGFVDGLFCGVVELDKDFSKFREKMEEAGVTEKLREIVNNAKK